MKSYEMDFKLKQLTPIVLGNGSGPARIRPTEFKSKFDKFISKYEKKANLTFPDSWKTIKDGVTSFKYKIRIIINSHFEEIDKKELKNLILANMDRKNNKEIKPYFCSGDIIIKIVDITEEKLNNGTTLLENIKNLLPTFVKFTSFGLRSGKGFGSFICLNISNKNIDDLMFPKYYFVNKNTDSTRTLQYINKLSNTMKSGLNQNGKSTTGMIFYYFFKKGIIDDKTFIKQKLLNFQINSKKPNSNFRYIRALLGLAPSYSFRNCNPRVKDSYRNCNPRVTVNIESNEENKIQRFKSPVLFKVIEDKILIIPDEIPKEMLNSEFSFSINKGKKLPIRTPETFDLEDFLDKFMEVHNKMSDGNSKDSIVEKYEVKNNEK